MRKLGLSGLALILILLASVLVQTQWAFQNPYPLPRRFERQPQASPSGTSYDQPAVVRTGSASPQTTTGPVYSAPPELSPQQAEARRAGIARSNRRGPVPATNLTPRVERSLDPATNAQSQTQGFTDFTVQTMHDLTEIPSNQRAAVHEPSLGNMGNTIFYSANWYAAVSSNGGQTFSYVNPSTAFPSINGGFCCDQVVHYAPTQDMMLWSLMYLPDASSGTLRIARAVGSTAVQNNTWTYYNFNPQMLGFATNNWMDFPNMTVSSNYLYVSSNVFSTVTDQFTGDVVFRIPLSQLAAGGAITYEYFFRTDGTFGLRCTEGATTTMYCAAVLSTTAIRIFSWPDNVGGVGLDDVSIAPFTYMDGDGIATTPDGRNWAARADSRMMGAWVANNVVGMMWMARQDASHPYPYTIVLTLDRSTLAVVTQTSIWNPSYAWMYPTASPNAAGNLAGLLYYGGGSSYQTAVYWIVDDIQSTFAPLATFLAAPSSAGPAGNVWGDYVTVRKHKLYPNTWVGGMYYMGSGGLDSNSVGRYAWFGRVRDLPGLFSAPTVTINQAVGQADPTASSPIKFTVLFSEAVSDFTASDLLITGTSPGSKTATVTGSFSSYEVSVTGMTGPGTVIVSIPAGIATGISSGYPNTASSSTDNTVTFTGSAPVVTINQAAGQQDPTSLLPIRFTVVFNQAVSGFTYGDMNITGTAPGTKTVTITGGPSTYQVAVGGITGTGTVIAAIPANVVTSTTSGLPNTASTSTDNTVSFQNPPPPTITSFTPSGGVPGTAVTISGTNLAGATAVSFNGVPAASFVVNTTSQLIKNPGFETGLAGWTIVDQSGGFGSFYQAFQAYSPYSFFSTAGPHSGSYYMVTDVGAGAHVLLQSFTIPSPAINVTLSFSMFANDWDSGPYINAAGLDFNAYPNQHARVDLLSSGATPFTTGTGVLRNFYLSVDPHANPNPYKDYSFDITDLVGSGGTFQVRFGEVDNQYYLNLGVDDVNVTYQPQSPTITAIVPAGVTNGPITVTTPSGAVTSSSNFVLAADVTIAKLALTTTPVIFGTDASEGNLLKINATSGAGTVVGPMSIGVVPALAIDPTTGLMYAGTGGGLTNLYRVNPASGATTLVGPTNLGFAAISDMAFSASGLLYAAVNIVGDGGTGSDHLATIDKTRGVATVIGPFGSCGLTCTIEGLEGMAFDATGFLYSAHTARSVAGPPGLYHINPATGGATFIAPIVDASSNPPSGGVTSLHFAPDGTLYGGTATGMGQSDGGRLIKINPVTGLFSFVGSSTATHFGRSIGGLALQLHGSGTAVYTINVRNIGLAPADNVAVSDPLPMGVSFISCIASVGTCSASANTVTAGLDTLAVGATASVTIQVNAPIGVNISNTATVSTSTPEATTDNNSASVSTTADMRRRSGQITSQ